MSSTSFPVVALNDGTFVQCDSLPTIPCFQAQGPTFACWDFTSNCWGALVNATDALVGIPIPSEYCTFDTCPLDSFQQAHFSYVPTLPGNALFAAIFAIIFAIQLAFAFRYRTWSFFIGMAGGLLLECAGYIGRILIHNNPFAKNPFLIYLICLTIGPAFLSASIYCCLGRIVIVYGEPFSRFRPSTYAKIFIPCDLVALILQAIGGALASTANDQTSLNRGTNIMISGLAFQVFSLLLFMVLCADLMLNIYSGKFSLNPNYAHIRSRGIFKFFLYAIGISTVAIFVRSVFRVAELSKGFHGPLNNQEITFMVLEGVMIILAVTVLTIGHPGYAFDGLWGELQSRRKGDGKEGPWVDSDGNGSGSERANAKGQGVAVSVGPY